MVNLEDIYRRGHRWGGHAVQMLADDKVKGLVVVTLNDFPLLPVFVGIPENDGLGYDTLRSNIDYARLLYMAKLQATYASRTQGRSAAEQLKKLRSGRLDDHRSRSPHAYGVGIPDKLRPQWAHDLNSGLTVVVVANKLKPQKAVEYAEASRSKKIDDLPKFNAAALVNLACLARLQENLSGGNVAVSLLALPQAKLAVKISPPPIVSELAGGTGKIPKTFDVVLAKAYCTVQTNLLPSGPETGDITGAILVTINGTSMVMAAGGLPSGEADVAAIHAGVARYEQGLT